MRILGKVAIILVVLATRASAQAAEIYGSGVVIGIHGEVLTNAHVVKQCTRITVRSSAQDSAVALVLARDDENDLAVVRSSTPLSQVATFRDGPVRAGDAVVH
jgi:serine protease Do